MPEISELIHIGCLVFVLFSFRVAFAIGNGCVILGLKVLQTAYMFRNPEHACKFYLARQ